MIGTTILLLFLLLIIIRIFLIFAGGKPEELMDKPKVMIEPVDPLQIAKDEYNILLNQLKTNSNNAELKSQALIFGKNYYSLLREDGVLTIYDEQALLNDINAHCVNENTNKSSNNQIFKDIEQLASLKEKGILSEEEFQEKKKVLLEKI